MPGRKIWECSSSHADMLREKSWGSKVMGTAVPHPYEYLNCVTNGTSACEGCTGLSGMLDYITVCYPNGFSDDLERRGPLPAYLGSRTTESTNLFHPWEKESTVPLVDRAARLRTAINWFVEPNSEVAKSILNNLSALTGEDWAEEITSFSRTGSALHRFFCTRQSNGGFVAISPSALTRLIVTADTMTTLSMGNYDFMYQPSLLYAETASTEMNRQSTTTSFSHHFHISCPSCIRPIFDINLSSPYTYQPPDRSRIIRAMCGMPAFWNRSREGIPVREGVWTAVHPSAKSFHIGRAQGLLFGLLTVDRNPDANDGSLFPVIVGPSLLARPYLIGILQGLSQAASYSIAYHESPILLKRPKELLQGSTLRLAHLLSRHPGFANMMSHPSLLEEVRRVSHKVPSSYPPSQLDMSDLIETYFTHHILQRTVLSPKYKSMSEILWIFADSKTPRLTGLSVISHRLNELFRDSRMEGKKRSELNELKQLISYYCSRKLLSPMEESSLDEPDKSLMTRLCSGVRWCREEVRHAARSGLEPTPTGILIQPSVPDEHSWKPELIGRSHLVDIDFVNRRTIIPESVVIPRLTDPLINGLRLGQLATGAHYKLRCLLSDIRPPRAFLCGGDGSGGMTASLLRAYPRTLGIFNSLMTLKGRSMRGSAPGPPSALASMEPSIRYRCVNLATCWDEPSDLSEARTWDYFLWLISYYKLEIDLVVLDFEHRTNEMTTSIENLMGSYLPQILTSRGCLIYKTYGSMIKSNNARSVNKLGPLFQEVKLGWTDYSGSFTSELYLVCRRPLTRSLSGKYASSGSVASALSTCCANHTLHEELIRARRIIPSRMLQGIPPELIPSPVVELTTVLIKLGMSPNYASEVSDILQIHRSQPIMIRPVCISVLGLLSNAILDITVYIGSGGYAPPSDQRLQRQLTFFIGTWLFLTWAIGDETMYLRMHRFLSGPITYLYTVTLTRTDTARIRTLSWDWSFKGRHAKTLQGPDNYGMIAAIIRIWTCTFMTTETRQPNWDFMSANIDRILSHFNRNLRTRTLLSNTGLMYPLFGKKFGETPDHQVIQNTNQNEDAEESRSVRHPEIQIMSMTNPAEEGA